jgi:hypothetical protein
MPATLKFVCPVRTDMEIRQRAHREGRSISDVILRAVERGLGSSPAAMPDAVVDSIERGSKGSKAVAAYLSAPLSSAIERIAQQENRSASWVMRDLIRTELRNRGLLPPDQRHQSADHAIAD